MVHIARSSIHTRICRQVHNAASDETYYAIILFHFRERKFYVLCSRAACAAGRAAPTASAQSTSRTARTGRTEDDKPILFRLLAFSTSFACAAYAVQRYMPAQGSHPMGLPVWQPAAMVAGLTRPHEVLQTRTQLQDFYIFNWFQRFASDTATLNTMVNKANKAGTSRGQKRKENTANRQADTGSHPTAKTCKR